MEAILASIISGLFSLAAIWYQNRLRKTKTLENNEPSVSKSPKNKLAYKHISSKWRIAFTLLIVICPLLLLILIGKESLFGGDEYLMEYYFIWVVITFVAILIGWKQKSIFERVILILSVLLLIYMTFYVMYETKRNAKYGINRIELKPTLNEANAKCYSVTIFNTQNKYYTLA